jgi:predicted metal-dependent hydrolase
MLMASSRYPDAYVQYLVQYHAARDYFECHEILEDYWKEHPQSRYRETWVMLIQLAVSLYHQRRGNRKGAIKLLSGAIRRYDETHMQELGVDGAKLLAMMKQRLASVQQNEKLDYTDLDIPITDAELLARCQHEAERQDYPWGRASDLSDSWLLNRHLLRDRSEVRREHEEALKRRQQRRSNE